MKISEGSIFIVHGNGLWLGERGERGEREETKVVVVTLGVDNPPPSLLL